ncbi:MAG TPA: M28 family peptidase [Chthonomonadales bacterium]|nr:M28 family peptidase [Chthonomonadales bacterium]
MCFAGRRGALALAGTLLVAGGCALDAREAPARERQTSAAPAASAPGTSEPRRVQRPAFDGDRAFALLTRQTDFGPRPPGTAAHRRTRDFLVAELSKYADRVFRQDFTYRGIPMFNVVGVFRPEAERRILLCAHWDTRPIADMEVDEAKRRLPILGANDGASGVAVLLELARMFKQQPPDVGVVIALFDGEDFGDFTRMEGVLLGSTHFARNLSEIGRRPAYGILLCMIGDRDLVIQRETHSERHAKRVNDLVFGIARELGYGNVFRDRPMVEIINDHWPLNAAGLPTINLIDFDYAPWHTLDDTPDKCSPRSLRIVGEVVAETVYRERAR